MIIRRVVYFLETVLFIILSAPIAIMPFRWSLKCGEILGRLLFYLWKDRREIAINNIRTSINIGALKTINSPEEIIKKNFENIGKSFVEVVKIFYGLDKKLLDSIHIEGKSNLEIAESKGKGVLFITGHCGNWELMALTMSAKFKNISVVARPLNNPYLNKLVELSRKRYGNTVIYKKGALKTVIQTLGEKGYVGILMDQAVLANEGYIIEFLGRNAWTTKMPALIARKTGAAVVPAFIHRTDGTHVIKIYPEVEISKNNDRDKAVIEDTKRFSKYIESYIQEHPSEWLWIHRRWKRVTPNNPGIAQKENCFT